MELWMIISAYLTAGLFFIPLVGRRHFTNLVDEAKRGDGAAERTAWDGIEIFAKSTIAWPAYVLVSALPKTDAEHDFELARQERELDIELNESSPNSLAETKQAEHWTERDPVWSGWDGDTFEYYNTSDSDWEIWVRYDFLVVPQQKIYLTHDKPVSLWIRKVDAS